MLFYGIASLVLAATSAMAGTLTVAPSTVYQNIDGFGGMDGWTYMQNTEIDIAYKKDSNSLGLTILRVRLSENSNDWGNIANSVKEAYAQNPNIKVFASAWTAPSSYLDTNVASTCKVQHMIATSKYAAYAAYLQSFVDYMKSKGAPLYAISMQNEPDWTWNCWSAAQMRDWLKAYGSQVTGAKMIAPEALGFSKSWHETILADSTAAANVDILGGHLYGSTPYSFDSKGKQVWMTEHLYNDNVGWTETMSMATEIHKTMAAGWNAYVWWYIKRYYSFIGDGESGSANNQVLPRGWVFSLWSKNVLPDYKRIGISGSSGSIAFTAYSGSNKIVVMLVNTGSATNTVIQPASSFSGVTASFVSSSNQKVFTLNPASTSSSSATFDVPASSVGAIVFTVGSSPATTTTTKPAGTTTTATTVKTTTTTTKPVTTTSSSGSCSAKYAQCGGSGWTGAKCCVSGSTCTYSNDWYSQCL